MWAADPALLSWFSARLFGRKGRSAGQSGQGMVEYALILALVALIVVVALIATGGGLINLYSTISTTMCRNHVGC
jgi:pilus assembly protein Flp/PilA